MVIINGLPTKGLIAQERGRERERGGGTQQKLRRGRMHRKEEEKKCIWRRRQYNKPFGYQGGANDDERREKGTDVSIIHQRHERGRRMEN